MRRAIRDRLDRHGYLVRNRTQRHNHKTSCFWSSAGRVLPARSLLCSHSSWAGTPLFLQSAAKRRKGRGGSACGRVGVWAFASCCVAEHLTIRAFPASNEVKDKDDDEPGG